MLNIARHWLFTRYTLSDTTWTLPKDNMLSSQALISDGSKNTSCSCIGSILQSDVYVVCCPS